MSEQAASLKNQVIDGLKWSILAKLLTQVFSWISTFMVIRLLTPNDYGIVAISMVFFTFISVFTTNGLTSSLVRLQKRDKVSGDQIFTISLLMNVSLSLMLFVASPYIAESYNNDALGDVLLVLALVNPITSALVVPAAHLQMEMRFKEKALSESVAALTAAATALICAISGLSFWSLIISNIVLNFVRVIGYLYFSKSKFWFTANMDGVKPLFQFAMNIQLGTFVWFAYNKADIMIVGKMLGLEKLGVYNVAGEIASVPMTKIGSILNDVGFAAFSKVKDDASAAKEYLKKALRLTGVVAFPVFFGVSAISHELTLAVVGNKWIDAAPVMAVLCLVFPFRMLTSVMSNFANGMGESKFTFHNGIVTSFILIVAIYVGSLYGLMEIAIGWFAGFMLAYFVLLVRYLKKFNLSMPYLTDFLPTIVVSASMWSVVTLTGEVLYSQVQNVFLVLLVKVLAGVLFVMPFYYKLYFKELLSLVKR